MNDDRDFAERLAAPTPTPGGGAAAARAGLHGAALLRMVTSITLSRHGSPPASGPPPELDEALQTLRGLADRARDLGEEFSRLERADIEAFDAYLSALRLPRGSPEEKARRTAARLEAAREATEAPLSTLEAALETLDLARRLLDLSSTIKLRATSDIGGAVELAHAAFRTAELNVRANLPALGVERPSYEERLRGAVGRLESAYPLLRRAVAEQLGDS